ncbi:uncharacterized protein [Diadema antillarum]|uniref:uncharacterized protein n=1 Tax=Diadema antillarum TaxID=105358 RepID=UPI003A83EEFB
MACESECHSMGSSSPHSSNSDFMQNYVSDEATENDSGDSDDTEAESDEDTGSFTFSDSLNEPLFQGSQLSKAEALLAVLSFVMQHCLSAIAVSHLFQLLNVLLGICIFKSTTSILRRIFCNDVVHLTFHFYCLFCYSYVQSYKTLSDDEVPCPHCSNPCIVRDLSNCNFFVTANLKSQIKALFERNDIGAHLSYRNTRQKAKQNNIEDIYDGKFYKEMMEPEQPLPDPNNYSYSFNSDGMPIFQSSKYSIWPLYIMINELPPHLRNKNLILAGVWFGKNEPKMEIFLEKFTSEAEKLSNEGVSWKQGDEVILSKFFPMCCCADAPARSAMQNSIKFNGYSGCGLCYHPGKNVDTVVKYPVDVCDYSDRTDQEMLDDMAQAIDEQRSVRGVKGPSPLINLSHFRICWGFPADFMHCLLLGVVRQLADLWFSSPSVSQFYIGSQRAISVINERLKSIQPPGIVARPPRPISERKFWKASEWHNWLLFYSVPCLLGILPTCYLNHLIVLVEASFLLLQKSISIEDINRSDVLMYNFVCRCQLLYGAAAMTFNVHTLTHLSKSVYLWGPLWTHSCFPFEAANWQIKRHLAGNRGIIVQVMEKFLLLQDFAIIY